VISRAFFVLQAPGTGDRVILQAKGVGLVARECSLAAAHSKDFLLVPKNNFFRRDAEKPYLRSIKS
jgi:hypothetical protein